MKTPEQVKEEIVNGAMAVLISYSKEPAAVADDEILCDTDLVREQINAALTTAEQRGYERGVEENKRYREAVHKAYNVGHNVDCMFCGFKDKALGEAMTPPNTKDSV